MVLPDDRRLCIPLTRDKHKYEIAHFARGCFYCNMLPYNLGLDVSSLTFFELTLKNVAMKDHDNLDNVAYMVIIKCTICTIELFKCKFNPLVS